MATWRIGSGAARCSDDDALVTMALATRGTNFCKPDVVRYEWELAKELGINITVHVAMDRFGYTKGQLTGLRDLDLLYPNTTYIHASHLTDEEWLLVRDSGGNVSLAPQIEMQMGHGWAPAQKAESLGIPVGLSSDVATTASSDQFTQMHAIFASERGRRHQASWDADLDGLVGTPDLDHRPPGAPLGDARWGEGGGHRGPDRLDHARQEGRPGHHRWPRGQRRAHHRPGRGGGLRRGHLQRGHRVHQRRRPEARAASWSRT